MGRMTAPQLITSSHFVGDASPHIIFTYVIYAGIICHVTKQAPLSKYGIMKWLYKLFIQIANYSHFPISTDNFPL